MDDDEEDVFRRTVDWAIDHGITTATFHIETPYPGTRLFARMQEQGRLLTRNWDLDHTRHVVFQPARLKPEALKYSYNHRAYRESRSMVVDWTGVLVARRGETSSQAFLLCLGLGRNSSRCGTS